MIHEKGQRFLCLLTLFDLCAENCKRDRETVKSKILNGVSLSKGGISDQEEPMKKKSIKRNFIYSLLYQILTLITPLISAPHTGRALGPAGIGEVSYATSIVAYFALFANMGISLFGTREISYVQNDPHKRSIVFWETKLMGFLSSGAALAAYLAYVLAGGKDTLYFVLTFELLASFFDVNWFFQGMEEFGQITLRSTIVRLVSLVYMLTVIQTEEDKVLFALGIHLFTFLSNLSLWPHLRKYITRPSWSELHPLRHFPVMVSLFIPTIAVQLYSTLDKTMIGMITGSDLENGYYEQAIKLARMLVAVITTLSTVMIPRIGHYFQEGRHEETQKLLYRAYRFTWFLSIPMCFGLIAVVDNFIGWFYGPEFAKSALLLKYLAFLIPAIGLNNLTGNMYLIPTKRQRQYTLTVLAGLLINVGLNSVLIRTHQSAGAAAASVAAESSIAILQLFILRREISARKVLSLSAKYLAAGGCMLLVLVPLSARLPASAVSTFLMVAVGAVIYLLVLLILRDSFLLENIRQIGNRFLHRENTLRH